MKINNKSSTTTTSLSWLGKVCLGLTALIFVSCGFMDNKEEKNELGNIGDYVDFVSLGISVEEKAQPTFSLVQDDSFGLVEGRLNCDKIDYSWSDSASGYNPTLTGQGINTVKFIDKDIFTFQLDALICTTGGDPTNEVKYEVEAGEHTFADTETRLYKAAGKQDLEVTQSGACDVNACNSESSIGFSLQSFKLDNTEEEVGAASFQEEIGITFDNGEPIPALSLKHLQYLRGDGDYDSVSGHADLDMFWECDVDVDGANNDLCSGQDMKNLRLVFVTPKDIADYDIETPGSHLFQEGAVATQEQLIAGIKFVHALAAPDDLRDNAIEQSELLAPGATPSHGATLTANRNGLEGKVQSDDGFYDEKHKYACIYSVGQDGVNEDLDDIGAKCKKVVFQAITPNVLNQ